VSRAVDRETRRAELIAAASAIFAERGVANTTVSDIVKAAGVAQGTFYLYFDSKDAVVLAVVELVVDAMVSAIEAAAHRPHATAVDKLLGLRDALSSFEGDPAAADLAAFIHRPENCALHDRLAEKLAPRLVPLVEAIVAQGVAEGAFVVADARAAAWFVLAGLQSTELAGTAAADLPAAIAVATDMALRALGYQGPRS